ncbi:hypothetical protein SNE40_004008 [Patella caerulea]|uniref:Serine protease n=1 Tax=Patella caerulea TaxID=87958 RepID=A0AAN8Q641_PATCE
MLPGGYRDKTVDEFIKQNAKRVVQIVYKTSYGSGIVFKLGGKLCIQTSYHVVRKAHRDWLNIEINIGDTSYKIDTFWGGCQKHDMVLLKLKNGPKQLRRLPITDINQQVVDITVDGNSFKGLVEYHRGEHRFIVHALNFVQRRLDDDTEVTCKFMNVDTPSTCCMRDVCYCSDTGCVIIFLDSDKIPDGAKNIFHSQKLMETVHNPLVVVLSHPFGQVKHISTGNVMHGECDKNGFPQYKPAGKICFKIEGDNETCFFGDSIGISNNPEEIGSAVGQTSAITTGVDEDRIVGEAEGVCGGSTYFLVNSNRVRVKFPIIEDVTSYFSCSDYDTKNAPVNRDDNRKYFYAREGQVYCSTDGLILPVCCPGKKQIFTVKKHENTVIPQSWRDRGENQIKFPLLDKSKIYCLNIDDDSSYVLGFNVYRSQDKVYFPGEIEDDPNPVYFLVGRDGMVISRDKNDEEIFVQTDMDGNKGFFKVNEDGYKTYVYEPGRARYLVGEDPDGSRVYFEEDKDGKKGYYTMQNFQKDQHGSRIFRRTDTKEDQKVYYRNKEGKNNPFQIDEENNKVYRLIDYNNKKLYTMKYTNDSDKFVNIHNVIHLNHNAETAPGSSGGCVLVIGKDEQKRYQCLVCMHKGKTENPPVNKAIVYRLRE